MKLHILFRFENLNKSFPRYEFFQLLPFLHMYLVILRLCFLGAAKYLRLHNFLFSYIF
jgi:hypothetical protein